MVLRRGSLLLLACLLLVLAPMETWAGKRATKNQGGTVKKTKKSKGQSIKGSSSARGRSPARRKRRIRRRRDLWPPMKLEHVNTREKLTIRLYDRRGRTIRASVRRLDRFLRCHHTGKHRRMHWRLIQRLYRISRRFNGRVIRVFSGYRSPKVARTRTSKHTVGRAIDFAVKGVSTRKIRDYILATYKTKRGLGYYPNTPFVHFDVREKSAFWVDYSGKGEEPRYSTNPFAVLRHERIALRKGRSARRTASRRSAEVARSTRTEPMGPPAPRMGPLAPPVVAPIDPMGPPRPPELDRVETAKGPPPVGPSPNADADADADAAAARPAAKPEASPEDEGPAKRRATTKSSPARPPATKDASGPVSNVRGAPP
jgi:uncharacterized protein YcbK (DUF882 family)